MNRVLLTPRRNFIDCTVNAKTKGNRLMVRDEGRNQKKVDRWMEEEGLSSLLEEERRVGWHKMDVSVVMSQG